MFESTVQHLASRGMLASSMSRYAAFMRASRRPEEVHRGLLHAVIAANRETAYGRRHGFSSIRSYEDFRTAPVCGYEDLEEHIGRIRQGEKAVLTSEDVLALVPTSGSSSATKLIPYTPSLLRQFRAALTPWLASLFLHTPALHGGSQYWVTSPHTLPGDAADSRVPVSFMPDGAYLSALQMRCCSRLMCVPHETSAVADTESFLYLSALFLLREENLRLISVWHPSVLSILADTIERRFAELTRDLRQGTISASAVPDPASRALCVRHLRPCAGRAALLESIDPGAEGFRRVWPELKVLSCWADGWSAHSLPALAGRFPQAAIQPKGLLATEGVVSIPIGAAGGRAAAVTSHFLEFKDSGTGDILPLWRIEKDRIYSTIMTTGGGLYRYELNDLVKVTGFFNSLPLLEFLGRDNCLSDLVGEKLHLGHVEAVIQQAERELGTHFSFAMMAPDETGSGYVFFYSAANDPDTATLQAAMEQGLMENYHYLHARSLSQLAPLRLFRTCGNPERNYLEKIAGACGGMGDANCLPCARRETGCKHSAAASRRDANTLLREDSMFFINCMLMLQMFLDKKSRVFLRQVHRLLKQDPSYSLVRLCKAMRILLSVDKMIKLDNGQFFFNMTVPSIPSDAFMTFIKATPSSTNIFSQHARIEKSAPATFCFAVTNACSYKCYYCSNDGKKPGPELTTDEWIRVAKDVQDMNGPTISFTGGEPLMRPDLERIIAAIDSRSVTYLLTTGCGLDEKRAASLKKSGLYGIAVSLNSYDRDTDNKIRGVNVSFDNAVRALKLSVSHGFYTAIISVIPKVGINREELFKLFNFAKSLGVKDVVIMEPKKIGRALYDINDISYTDETRRLLLKIQAEANRIMSGMKVSSEIHVQDFKTLGCSAGVQHSYISASGELQPCDLVPLSFGNVRQTSIKELWPRMHSLIGKPKGRCMGEEVADQIREMGLEQLPTAVEDSCSICKKLRHFDYPGFYKTLQGD